MKKEKLENTAKTISTYMPKKSIKRAIGIIIWVVLLLIAYGALTSNGPGKNSAVQYVKNEFKQCNKEITNVKILGPIEEGGSQTEGKQIKFSGIVDGIKVTDAINYKKENNKWVNNGVGGIKNNKLTGLLTPDVAKQVMKGEQVTVIDLNNLAELTLTNGQVNLIDGEAQYNFKYLDKEVGITNTVIGVQSFEKGDLGWSLNGSYSQAKLSSKLESITDEGYIDLFVKWANSVTYGYAYDNINNGVTKEQCKVLSSNMNSAQRTATAVIRVTINGVVEDYTIKCSISNGGVQWTCYISNTKNIKGSVS